MELFRKFFGHSKQPDKPTIPVEPPSKVDKQVVARLIEQRKYELAQPPKDEIEQKLREAANKSQEASLELLEELAHTANSSLADRKFVREGKRVRLASSGFHVDIAILGKMESPDDAGSIKRDGDEERLVVKDGSFGLQIDHANENRAATVQLLQSIAPNIQIVQGDR